MNLPDNQLLILGLVAGVSGYFGYISCQITHRELQKRIKETAAAQEKTQVHLEAREKDLERKKLDFANLESTVSAWLTERKAEAHKITGPFFENLQIAKSECGRIGSAMELWIQAAAHMNRLLSNPKVQKLLETPDKKHLSAVVRETKEVAQAILAENTEMMRKTDNAHKRLARAEWVSDLPPRNNG